MSAFERKGEAGGLVPPAPGHSSDCRGTVEVWDPLIRLFHWALVAAFGIAWVTGEELQGLHEATGYVVLGLLTFRLVWGFVGTTYARFSDFVHPPRTVIAHVADSLGLRAVRYLGHNPAGGAMVIALLLALAATAATGALMTSDAFQQSEWAEDLHESLANLVILLVALHLAGVTFASLEHRENLARAMITGRKRRDR